MRIRILSQPDDFTCGPTTLHAVYRHHGLDLSLEEVIRSVDFLEDGGTLAVFLGLDALRRGFVATLFSYNLRIFDPTWRKLGREGLLEKLDAQLRHKRGQKFVASTRAYQAFLRAGGELRFDDPSEALLREFLDRGSPVLAGLSATYLYGSSRERHGPDGRMHFDDLRGTPQGHFVVLGGFEGDSIVVADPYRDNPLGLGEHHYLAEPRRLLNAILLGIVTYDANLLIIEPGAGA